MIASHSHRNEFTPDTGTELYLDLLKRSLINLLYENQPVLRTLAPAAGLLGAFDQKKRLEGQDWPSQAFTMIGMYRLNNVQTLVEEILRTRTPGDLIETGVWRGGSTIFMRGLLKAYGVTDRTVWVADSFQGLPSPDQEGLSSRAYSSPELSVLREGPPPAVKAIMEQS